jgi:hypothetical protein
MAGDGLSTAPDLIAAHKEARAKVDGYTKQNRLNVIFKTPRTEAPGKRHSDLQELILAEDNAICDLLESPYADDEEFLTAIVYAMTARPRFVELVLAAVIKAHVDRAELMRRITRLN